MAQDSAQGFLFDGRELQSVTVQTPAGDFSITKFMDLAGREGKELPTAGWVRMTIWHRVSGPDHPLDVDKDTGDAESFARKYKLKPTAHALTVDAILTEAEMEQRWATAHGAVG